MAAINPGIVIIVRGITCVLTRAVAVVGRGLGWWESELGWLRAKSKLTAGNHHTVFKRRRESAIDPSVEKSPTKHPQAQGTCG